MSPARKELDRWGRKGRPDYVRLVREPVEGVEKLRVLWKDAAGRHAETFDDSRNGQREARAFAEAKHDALRAPAPPPSIAPISLRDLRDKFITAMETEWSANTLRLRLWRWGKLELYAGRDTLARDVSRETLDGLKKALLANHSPNQVRQAIKEITGVFRWGVDRDLIPPTKVITYRPGLKKALLRSGPKMEEYSRDERDRLQAAFDPRNGDHWRAWALNVLFAYCGPRQTAARHLEIGDIQLDPPVWAAGGPVFGGRIQWRAETNKTQQDWAQPMPGPVAEAFWVALGWRQRDGYTGRFIFYGVARKTRGQALRRDSRDARAKSSMDGITVTEKPYSYAAFNNQLHRAEQRAGMETIKYRAAHAHRRGVAGDVHAATGSLVKAAEWIGDRSTKVVRDHYLLQREEELAKTAGIMAGPSETEWQRLQKGRARARVSQALAKGELVKGPCRYEANGDCNGVIEAHHYLGYDDKNWLDVEWFCHRHHARVEGRPKQATQVLRNATDPNSGSESLTLTPSREVQPSERSEPAVGIEPTTARFKRGR